MPDDHLMAGLHQPHDGRGCLADRLDLSLRGIAKGIAAQRNDNFTQDPSSAQHIVAKMTALMVCIRFSASSKTRERSEVNTSSVTSISGMPNFL